MDLGLNIAASGMLAEQVQQDQLANDLANASTAGYKPQGSTDSSFDSLLQTNAAGHQIGSIYERVAVSKGSANLAQGPLQPTGQPLDFAIDGSGFFAVKTAAGVQYTRNGQFSTNAQGLLVDQFGDQVLSQSGGPIKVGSKDSVPASALGIFDVPNASQLGNNNFSGTAAGRGTGSVEPGELEGSGVDAIQTMTQMTTALEAYQAGQQAISTINQTMQESASQVALVQGGA